MFLRKVFLRKALEIHVRRQFKTTVNGELTAASLTSSVNFLPRSLSAHEACSALVVSGTTRGIVGGLRRSQKWRLFWNEGSCCGKERDVENEETAAGSGGFMRDGIVARMMIL